MRLGLVGAAVALAVTLTGCGGEDSSELGGEVSSSEEGAPNGGDGGSDEGDDEGGDGGDSDVAALPEMAVEDVCALVPDEVAEAALGAPIGEEPQGQSFEGLGVNCIWETADGFEGPQLKIEFNTLMWQGSSSLAGPGGEVGEIDGHETVSYEGGGGEFVLVVKLGGDDEPALYIEAPEADGAEAVAVATLESLG